MPLPVIFCLTVGITPGCIDPPVTVPLTWDGSGWTGTTEGTAGTLTFTMTCTGTTWTLDVSCNGLPLFSGVMDGTCDPFFFQVTFGGRTIPCCSGRGPFDATITVTECP
jgi:hypothetical protein